MIIVRIKGGDLHCVAPKWTERTAVQAAGWRWRPEWRCWWTNLPDKVAALVEATGAVIEGRDCAPELVGDVAGSSLQVELAMLGEKADHPSFATDTEFMVPRPCGLEYLPFQRAGVEFAMGRDRCIIGDDMGLGKTMQALGVLNCLSWRSVLVLCPASLKLNWKDEAEKWLVHMGDCVRVVKDGKESGPGVYICNYEVAEKHKALLYSRCWDVVICDEAQYLANWRAKRTRVVLGGPHDGGVPCRKLLLLTGTPVSNKVEDLWPLLKACLPDRFGDRNAFVERYGEGRNLAELQSVMRDRVMVRRLKSQVLKDLPEKWLRTVHLEGASAEAVDAARVFRVAKKAYVDARVAPAGRSAAERMETLQKVETEMRAALAQARKLLVACKARPTVEYVSMALEQERAAGAAKVIVFVHHKEMARAMREAFPGKCVEVTGENAKLEDRHEAVRRFQTDPAVEVFIGSRAAESGLTLTAARRVIMAEPHWNPSAMDQAADRAHRIGQTRAVQVDYLVQEGTVDEDIMKSLERKRGVIAKAVN